MTYQIELLKFLEHLAFAEYHLNQGSFVIKVSPSERADIRSTLLVILFEPGRINFPIGALMMRISFFCST